MVREYNKRFVKEIRPRIKLYKFDDLPEDIQDKLINDYYEFYGSLMSEDLTNYAKEMMKELLDKNKFTEISDLEIPEWDIYSRYLHSTFKGYSPDNKYEISWKKGNLDYIMDNEYNEVTDDEIVEEITDNIKDIEKKTLNEITKSYEQMTDIETIKEQLRDYLYDINGKQYTE